jgi:hypothetical protein
MPASRTEWIAIPATALLAALPVLAALAVFGVIETPDSPGYIAYAAQLRHALPTGPALLREAPAPITLFRMGGYPVLLAALQSLTPHWRLATVLLQIAALSALAAASRRAALRLGAAPGPALAAALLPATGFGVVVQLCILTDALYAALAAGAALALATPPTRTTPSTPPGRASLRPALAAGLMLALATTLREATPLLALAYLPLALLPDPAAPHSAVPRRGRRTVPVPLLHALLVVLPALSVAAAQIAWNVGRGAGPVLTTSRQTVMVQAVLPLLRRHPDLLAPEPSAPPLPAPGRPASPPSPATPDAAADATFDAAARATIGAGEYGRIDDLHRQLFAAGLDAPAMASAAGRLYRRAWLRHPGAMLLATLGNLRHEFLALPFQPVDTVGALMVYAGWPRPAFDRLNVEWSALRHAPSASTRAAAALWIAADVLTRLLGSLIALAAILSPWLPAAWWPAHRRAAAGPAPAPRRPALPPDTLRRLRGLWLVCAGFVALYAPVHVEPRYLVPIVPLACIIAACAWSTAYLGPSASKAGPCPDPPKARGLWKPIP